MIEILKKYAFLIIVGVIIILFLIFTNDDEIEDGGELNAVITTVDAETGGDLLKTEQTVSDTTIAIVDVKGAVVKPGVYEINIDSRVIDVIQKAGGFMTDADQTGVNLAQKVQDEMVLVIPKIGEQATMVGGTSDDSGKIRINYATQEEIESLNGIGPSKAAAIIAYRDEHGFFQTVEDLLEVSGIGEKTLENMKDNLQVP
ncbi:competence protein ComEA [Oceanobacillus arenosus]|uniref:Competence protein ComEA n=1 Tax=Oceanobacillus arenosus TaxID=1229153 RepID=A0A3D8PTD2_9BACI|nr:helix-hairpin-helix domain-containing protein [Oceanobacillus arenosus]RDW19254.1 competence protein ComEA [Oceanobacillus arenosus]